MLLNEDQLMISSCTQRLLQIQQELQQQNRQQLLLKKKKLYRVIEQQNQEINNNVLSQQLISLVVMKQHAQRQLVQEQILLIQYLKQQLYQLSISNSHYQKLLSSVNMLEQKCQQISTKKTQSQQSQHLLLINSKKEYQQLQELLPLLTTQSTANYQLILRLRERNCVTQKLLQQKGMTKSQVQRSHYDAIVISRNGKQQLARLGQLISESKSTNQQLIKQFNRKSSQLQTSKQRLLQLQSQIQHYQLSNSKFKRIQQVAVGDNFILRQELASRIQQRKEKEAWLQKLNQQKQSQLRKKLSSKDCLQHLIQQHHSLKQKINSIIKSSQHLLQTLTSLQSQHQLNSTQLTTLNKTLSKLTQLKSVALQKCYSKQQQLQIQFYFIQQYLNVNNQLIHQIEILSKQQLRKQQVNMMVGEVVGNINRSMNDNSNRSISWLKRTLSMAKEQLLLIKLAHCSLVQQFQSFQVCR